MLETWCKYKLLGREYFLEVVDLKRIAYFYFTKNCAINKIK
ncbi:hypothetical protein B4147_0543 [Bacillus wiedmannii]|uniref:Uncharacterized protein n=1 Tax=Bacillus wiedmannii TaxID=1890302 RepID=A0A0G8C2Q9_9BACI|nr:hypothetical protein B4147_0543 [Bacillus wiedmannii]